MTIQERSSRQNFREQERPLNPALETRQLSVWYGEKQVLEDINITIPERAITAIIGPSGCGKSTLLKTFNRMAELSSPNVIITGSILLEAEDIYDPKIDPTGLRQTIGMVFQRPNPFPKTIFENVAFGLRINGFKGDLEVAVKDALTKAALWDEVSNRLNENASKLSGGQQQRLCIARALAVQPHILLMDEPCSSLDPIATLKVEELIQNLKDTTTIVIVTHNIEQAKRISDFTAFLLAENNQPGRLIEFNPTDTIVKMPQDPRTEAYMTGRFG